MRDSCSGYTQIVLVNKPFKTFCDIDFLTCKLNHSKEATEHLIILAQHLFVPIIYLNHNK